MTPEQRTNAQRERRQPRCTSGVYDNDELVQCEGSAGHNDSHFALVGPRRVYEWRDPGEDEESVKP